MSKIDFCSLILPQRMRRRLQESGIENDDDLLAAGSSFMVEAGLVLERRRDASVFTFHTALDNLKQSDNFQRIATWVPSIDAMLDGGIPRRKIIEVTGAAAFPLLSSLFARWKVGAPPPAPSPVLELPDPLELRGLLAAASVAACHLKESTQ
ncbi:uncharacterized protein LOC144121342 [Amblyomma americanum]